MIAFVVAVSKDGQSYPFGWEPKAKGFRGHVFATPDNSTVVVSIKGTSTGWLGNDGPTKEEDKKNDNLLFRLVSYDVYMHFFFYLYAVFVIVVVAHMWIGSGLLFATAPEVDGKRVTQIFEGVSILNNANSAIKTVLNPN
jgi:hypothetical protein